ncbi:isoprenylcysteine carboxyl methyltransferase [Heyndrickxia shackletonii]|uniref:Isoprenylcysteine carboxyl methyltransferase n=1 Tax=Heyndrickxia shackletonii TaxID=157838 RepID=A0A0Q3TIH9_9BACI|nr:isoprenylcysteine carboxylmethyltransferase family protein [Heyndrickxia shackletonii]KQL53750.1 isoprenylcysteine carboxyl methyltransferase [Heyndrickxia shackletonii]MBB2481556.1 isoprenylcysteine carboxyl methyltransferase [Bacillus sp. APMAM]NEY99896.1 isoprenylcysteine carboxyl methyltransferase [Heyndrickxia shackletonii]RTZ55048.1 isoprenylcysteine carboxyl methyltransferase [Bacillus sp. SAJ1]
MFFVIFISVIIIQRIVELWIAKKNEIWIKKQGGVEAGKNHYKLMVLIHSCFILSLLAEVFGLKRSLIANWWILIALFILSQIGRVWVIISLGRFWNTKILVLPDAKIIKKGPYRWLKHPNYIIVTLELIIIPLLFQAYYTLIAFFIFNLLILSVRIPTEERMLSLHTDYLKVQNMERRFLIHLKREK